MFLPKLTQLVLRSQICCRDQLFDGSTVVFRPFFSSSFPPNYFGSWSNTCSKEKALRVGSIFCVVAEFKLTKAQELQNKNKNHFIEFEWKQVIAHMAAATASRSSRSQNPPVDRNTTCPFLLRLFISSGAHNKPEDFRDRHKLPSRELQLHGWRDTTLRELTNLIRELDPALRGPERRLSFALIYADHRGRYSTKHLGITSAYRRGEDDYKTLDDARFMIGDYIDVCILSSSASSRSSSGSEGSTSGSSHSSSTSSREHREKAREKEKETDEPKQKKHS